MNGVKLRNIKQKKIKEKQISKMDKYDGSSRNWTAEGTTLFCEILSDIKFHALDKKALRKASTKEVFEDIWTEIILILFQRRKKEVDPTVAIRKLEVKYTNLKQP